MNSLLSMIFIFFSGSTLGWCLETVFRRFCPENKSRKWINPGFLIGPYLPLYGFGLCILYILSQMSHLLPLSNPVAVKIIVIMLMALCMTLLELIAGLIFVKGMNVELWNYSDKPFNYKGIICLEFSIYWLALATIYYLFIHKYVVTALQWFSSSIVTSFILGILFGIFIIDLCYSLQIASKIRKFAAENDILVRYEELKAAIRRYADDQKEKYLFLFAFRSKIPLHDHLKRYFDLQEAFKKLKDVTNQDKNKHKKD